MEAKSVWIIPSRATVRSKVIFEKDVSMEEALKLFEQGEYEDIMDEDIEYKEVLDWAE